MALLQSQMIVISDTTALSNLIQINELELLQKIYFEIRIPAYVHRELLVLEELGIQISEILDKEWIHVEEVENTPLLEKIILELDRGEAEAIVLALESKADLILIDEKQGRRIAQAMGLQIIGTIGILLKAKQMQLIKSVREKMDELRQIGFWISDGLYQQIVHIESNLNE